MKKKLLFLLEVLIVAVTSSQKFNETVIGTTTYDLQSNAAVKK